MKNLFSIIFLIVFIISCGCNEEVITFDLTDQEKTIVPYKLNDVVKWIDINNTVYNGVLTEIKDRYYEEHEDCTFLRLNSILYYIEFNNFKYSISLDKSTITTTYLTIQEYVDNDVKKSFIRGIKLEDFTTVEFNGEIYENAVLIKQSVLGGETFRHLVYSKTNGIEFILFEDGTWYKRVE